MAHEVSRVRVKFVIEGIGTAEGELIRHLAPRTVDTITRALPLEGYASTWLEEVYFEVPVRLGSEKAVKNVEKGTIAYWPAGSAICIFYGSSQPIEPVNPMGHITSGLELFARVKAGTKIRVEKT
ncbi:hypothetical protein B6U66_01505 [Candidatus Bathyarchaeota archaeon ex4484_135]|nr:MAG: hypothetical protein B6U66_01505 [Candidatus Bathyarchaeota archaeon ex4484_135]